VASGAVASRTQQLTGIEKCQCRKQRAQRNHIACCYQAWLAIKVKADKLGKTLYATVHDLLYEFLRAELRDPRIPALEVTRSESPNKEGLLVVCEFPIIWAILT